MSELQKDTDLTYLKAQLANDDKELRELIKSVLGGTESPSSERKATARSKRKNKDDEEPPVYAQTQMPRLVEMPYNYPIRWAESQGFSRERKVGADWAKVPRIHRQPTTAA